MLLKQFLDLTKFGIVCFVLLSGMAGYALSHPAYTAFDPAHFFFTMLSLYFFSAGSFALNQAQEHLLDGKMERTRNRPVVVGIISARQAYFLGFGFILLGLYFGLVVKPIVSMLGLATVILYNLPYTLWWKRRWAFGAVPGAIPGAMPVVVGYAANSGTIFTPECIYGFMIMFLWQMPHFWSLAIRFKDDYAKGGIPVLPATIGTERTLYHMGLYTFAYVALAIASPWFTDAYLFYALIVVPFALKVLWEFFGYFKAQARAKWLPFFMWTNFSMLIFLVAPVADKWCRYWILTR